MYVRPKLTFVSFFCTLPLEDRVNGDRLEGISSSSGGQLQQNCRQSSISNLLLRYVTLNPSLLHFLKAVSCLISIAKRCSINHPHRDFYPYPFPIPIPIPLITQKHKCQYRKSFKNSDNSME